MKNHEIKFRSTIFTVLLTLAMFSGKTQTTSSQNEPIENKRLKYELSIDLVPIIDKGQFGKVYFKLNHYKEALLKGAYRFGISRGTYFLDNEDESTWPENVTVNPDKTSHFETVLSLGYEKYKRIGSVLTYFGLDILGGYYKDRSVPQINTNDQKIVSLGICPFWGIRHYILKNRLSASFEIGWENSFSRNTNQFDGIAFNYSISQIKLPYSFTINYHF
jgi:hypothetical protein